MTSDKAYHIIKSGLRSISASVPVASSIAQAWSEYENHLQFNRLEELFENLKEELIRLSERISEVRDSESFSEEIPTLIERTVEKVRRESSKQKRGNFAKLLANEIVAGNELNYDEKIDFIDVLDSLTDYDVIVLSLFEPREPKLIFDIEQELYRKEDKFFMRGIGDFVRSIFKLHSLGLIYEVSPSPKNPLGQIKLTKEDDSAKKEKDNDFWPFGKYGLDGVHLDFKNRYFDLSPYGAKFLTSIKTE